MLANTGSVNLQDAANATYLTVQAKSPLAWPPLFGVLAQGDISAPEQFNLLLVYQPPSGGVGVPVPVVVGSTTTSPLRRRARPSRAVPSSSPCAASKTSRTSPSLRRPS